MYIIVHIEFWKREGDLTASFWRILGYPVFSLFSDESMGTSSMESYPFKRWSGYVFQICIYANVLAKGCKGTYSPSNLQILANIAVDFSRTICSDENGFKMVGVGQTINSLVQDIKSSGPTAKYSIDFKQWTWQKKHLCNASWGFDLSESVWIIANCQQSINMLEQTMGS